MLFYEERLIQKKLKKDGSGPNNKLNKKKKLEDGSGPHGSGLANQPEKCRKTDKEEDEEQQGK